MAGDYLYFTADDIAFGADVLAFGMPGVDDPQPRGLLIGVY